MYLTVITGTALESLPSPEYSCRKHAQRSPRVSCFMQGIDIKAIWSEMLGACQPPNAGVVNIWAVHPLRDPSRHHSRHLQEFDSPAIPGDAGACAAACNRATCSCESLCMSLCRYTRLLRWARNFLNNLAKTGTSARRFPEWIIRVDAGSKCSCAGPCANRCGTASSTTSYPARTKWTRRSSATISCRYMHVGQVWFW